MSSILLQNTTLNMGDTLSLSVSRGGIITVPVAITATTVSKAVRPVFYVPSGAITSIVSFVFLHTASGDALLGYYDNNSHYAFAISADGLSINALSMDNSGNSGIACTANITFHWANL